MGCFLSRLSKKVGEADMKNIVEMLCNAKPEVSVTRKAIAVQCIYVAVRDEVE